MQSIGESELWRKRARIVLLVVAAVGWHLSYEGIRTLKPLWTSVELATVITIFHAFSWSLVYAAVPLVTAGKVPPGRRLIPMVIGVVAAAGIITTATFFSWINIASGPSQRKHFLDTIEECTTSLADLRDARQREQELRPVLSQTSESILRLAQDEEAHGALSRAQAKGPISDALYSLASAYADAAQILDKDEVAAQENIAEAERILATMRVLHAEASAHDDRVENVNTRFAQAAFRLSRLLADLKKSPLRSALVVVRKSDATISFLPTRRDHPGEAAAKAALVKLASDSKARIDQLVEGADRTFVKVPRFESFSREEAAIAYVTVYPQYPIICITIDLVLPLIGLLASIFFSPSQMPETPSVISGDRPPTRPATNAPLAPATKSNGALSAPLTTGDNRERIVQALRRSAAEKAARPRLDPQAS